MYKLTSDTSDLNQQLRPNKNTCVYGNPTLPKFTGETLIFFRFSWEKYAF